MLGSRPRRARWCSAIRLLLGRPKPGPFILLSPVFRIVADMGSAERESMLTAWSTISVGTVPVTEPLEPGVQRSPENAAPTTQRRPSEMRRRRPRLAAREVDGEGCSFTQGALDGNPPAVVLSDVAHDGQP